MDSQPPGAPCISVTHHSLAHKQAAGEEVSFSLQVLEQLSGNAAERERLSSPGIMSRRDCVSLKKYSPVLDVRAGLWRLQLWMCPLDTPLFLQRGTGKGCEEGTVQTSSKALLQLSSAREVCSTSHLCSSAKRKEGSSKGTASTFLPVWCFLPRTAALGLSRDWEPGPPVLNQ